MPRGYRCHLRHAHRTCRPGGPAGGRPGFNEDRRICPIKTSYKDPSGSTLIRKTSNLDFAAAASSYPALYRNLPTVIPLVIVIGLRLPNRAQLGEQRQGRQGFMELVSSTESVSAIPYCRADSTASSGKIQFVIFEDTSGLALVSFLLKVSRTCKSQC